MTRNKQSYIKVFEIHLLNNIHHTPIISKRKCAFYFKIIVELREDCLLFTKFKSYKVKKKDTNSKNISFLDSKDI